MARNWNIGRTEADVLIDLLENGDPFEIAIQRLLISDDLRELFGYVSLAKSPAHLEHVNASRLDIERAKVLAFRLNAYEQAGE